MEYVQSLKKYLFKRKYLLLFILLFLSAAFQYLYRFSATYHIGDGDVARDYLVAKHIAVYGERLTIGPWTSMGGFLRNNPLYYYFLSLFLLIRDDILTLGVFNDVFLLIALIVVFYIVQEMTSQRVAFIASALFVFNSQIAHEATMSWQPYWAHWVYLMSWVFFWTGYKNAHPLDTVIGVLIWLYAAVLHLSVLSTFPALIYVIIASWKRQRLEFSAGILIGIIIVFLGFVLSIPSIYWANSHVSAFSSQQERIFVASPIVFGQNFYRNLVLFLHMFFRTKPGVYSVFSLIAFALMLVATIHLLWVRSRTRSYGRFFAFIIVAFLLLISLVARPVYDHFFTPIVTPFLVLVSLGISSLFSERRLMLALSTFLFLWVFLIGLMHVNFNEDSLNKRWIWNGAKAIKSHVDVLKKTDPHAEERFLIMLYRNGDGKTYSDSIFWVPLEDLYRRPLVRLVDDADNYEPLNSNGYIFLVCQGYQETEVRNMCVLSYQQSNSTASFQEMVYKSPAYEIFLFKQNEGTL